jgi:hypothetical protein
MGNPMDSDPNEAKRDAAALFLLGTCIAVGLLAVMFLFITHRFRLRKRYPKPEAIPTMPPPDIDLEEAEVTGDDVPLADDDKI